MTAIRCLALTLPLALLAAMPAAAQDGAVRDGEGQLAIGFDKPEACEPNAALRRLIVFIDGRDGAERYAGAMDEVSGTLVHRLDFVRPEPWRGLSLTGVELVRGIESGPSNLSLLFAEPADMVLPVLQQSGFPLSTVGEAYRRTDREVAAGIVLEDDGRGSSLTCYSD